MTARENQIKTLPELKKKLHEFTEQYLHQVFTWETVKEWIEEILKVRVKDITMAALGYEWGDHWYGPSSHWRLSCRPGADKLTIQTVISDIAKMVIEARLPGWIKEHESVLLKAMNAPKTLKAVRDHYDEAFWEELHEKARDWAQEQAKTDVEKLFARGGEEFLKDIKLKVSLKMNDLRLMAEDDGQEG